MPCSLRLAPNAKIAHINIYLGPTSPERSKAMLESTEITSLYQDAMSRISTYELVVNVFGIKYI